MKNYRIRRYSIAWWIMQVVKLIITMFVILLLTLDI